jgi:hypothetical protein
VLQVPSPWACNIGWAPKDWRPAQAYEKDSARQKLFYALVDTKRHNEQVAPYLNQPNIWLQERCHPWGSEPHRFDELSVWAAGLYGSETLFRTMFPAHPGGGTEVPIYTVMDHKTAVYPVIIGNEDLMAITKYLAIRCEPFYKKGHGKVVCAVCVATPLAGMQQADTRPKYTPVLLTRMEYLQHFEKCHSKFLHFQGLSFPTFYHSRMHECTTMYNFVISNISYGADQAQPVLEDENKSALTDEISVQRYWLFEQRKLFQKPGSKEPNPVYVSQAALSRFMSNPLAEFTPDLPADPPAATPADPPADTLANPPADLMQAALFAALGIADPEAGQDREVGPPVGPVGHDIEMIPL